MLSPSARAINLSLLLVLPLVPAVAAGEPDAACAPEPCRLVPLYVLAGHEVAPYHGMSSLQGDAMPTEPTTRESVVRALTPPLAGELVLPKQGAFVVNLTSPTNAGQVQGSIVVSLRSLSGDVAVLARRDFLAAPTSEAVDRLVGTFGPVFSAAQAWIDDVNGTVGDRIATLEGNPIWAQTNLTYAVLCGGTQASWENPQCRAVSGRPVFGGAFDICVPQTNPTFALLWGGVATADNAAYGAAGRKVVCHAYYNDINATAEEHGGLVDYDGPPLPVPHDSAREALRNATTRNSTSSNGTAPQAWRDVALNATPPSWLPQDESSFRVPSGFRLQLDVDLVGVAPEENATYPLIFEFGRADTLTRLQLRTSTPHAFSALAYGASPILPGTHTGHFADLTDVDDYRFFAPPGVSIRAEGEGASRLTLYDPDGKPANGGSFVTAQGPSGSWTLRVGHGTMPPPEEYRFTLSLNTPGESARNITEGAHTDDLGPGDDEDEWTFPISKAQRFSIGIEHGADAHYRLERVPGPVGIWDVNATASEVRARGSDSGPLTFRVVREWGEGAYVLTLDLDEGGDLTGVPKLASTWTVPPSSYWDDPAVYDLSAIDGGIEFVHNGTLYRIDEGGARALRALRAHGPVGRTADGSLAYIDTALTLEEADAVNPLLRGAYSFAFGQDGAVYAAIWSPLQFELVKFTEDRRSDRISTLAPGLLRFAPDGTLWSTEPGSGMTHRVDFQNGTLTPAPSLTHLVGFDALGRAYRMLNRSVIERIDLSSGETKSVAFSDLPISAPVLAGDRIYAIQRELPGVPAAIATARLGVNGFEGFRPQYDPLPAPDIVPAGFEDTVEELIVADNGSVVGERHLLRLHVKNQGAGPAYEFPVWLRWECGAVGCATQRVAPSQFQDSATVEALGPGDSTTLEFRWDSSSAVGDQLFRVWVAPYLSRLAESNETNNMALYRTYAIVGGNERLCHTLLDDVPFPDPSVSGLRPLPLVVGGARYAGDLCYHTTL